MENITNNHTITIFTPTYNRGYIIHKLYESLLLQTNFSFEWLVIDDGSTDDTETFFTNLDTQNLPFPLRYIKKENGGKHTAANLALELAHGELFFVVDSDDVLTENSIERIFFYYNQIKDNSDFCGVCGLKGFFNGNVIGSEIKYNTLDATIIEYRFTKKIAGDKADVFRTQLLKQHRFPENKGEKWAPLSIVWNRFGSHLKVRYFNEIIYLAEYLEDGISLNRNKIRRNSPKNTKQYYKELSNYNIPLKYKIKSAINFWRFGLYSDDSILKSAKDLGFAKSLISFLPGYILYKIDQNRTLNKNFLDPKQKIINSQK
jgi:glycosyltransferase involved in cell wall biosynthesis